MPKPTSDVAKPSRSSLLREVASMLGRLEEAMERPPCAVVLGEHNAGKTSVVNGLLADGVLPHSVVANTYCFALLRYADRQKAIAVSTSGHRTVLDAAVSQPNPETLSLIEIGLRNSRLKDFEILDTPGGTSPADALALPPLSPLRIPLWCTVATQAWKESERSAWASLAGRFRRHGLLVVTGIDRINSPDDAAHLAARLNHEAAPHFRGVVYAAPREDLPIDGLTDLATALTSRAREMAARRKLVVTKLTRRLERLLSA